MGEAIGAVLGYAVGIAMSPLPVAAVILMLFSGRARSNSLSFMVAWTLGIATVATLAALIPGMEADSGDPSNTAGWIKLIVGLLLLFVAVRQWRSRPGPDEAPQLPGWMDKIDGLNPGAAFGLGFLLSAVNPKNLLLGVAAGATIGSIGLSTGETVGVIVVYTLIAASTVTVPVVAYLIAGHRIDPTLDAAKTWLIHNNATVMAVLLLVIGIVLVGDGIQILSN